MYFTDVWHIFEEMDTDHDRRMTHDEFVHGCRCLILSYHHRDQTAARDTRAQRLPPQLHAQTLIPGCSFCACDRLLGIDLSEDEAEEEFEIIDENGGGVVLFDEFCKWLAHRQEAQMRLGRVERPAARQQQQAQHTRPSSQQAERQPHPQQPGVNAAGMQTALATTAAAAAAPAPAASEVEARLRAEFEAEMLSHRQTSPAAPLAKTSKPRELYYAVSMNQPHTRATVAEFSARCLSGEVSRHAVMIWTSGMDSWSLPDDPVARQAIPELAELLPDV